MFSSSTPWHDYLIAVAIALTVYYSVFTFRFYRSQLRRILISRGGVWQNSSNAFESKDQFPHQQAPTLGDLSVQGTGLTTQEHLMFSHIIGLSSQLRDLIEEAHQKGYDSTELALLLQMVLKDHPNASSKPFRLAVNQFVDDQCAKYGSIHLGETDKAVIWDQV